MNLNIGALKLPIIPTLIAFVAIVIMLKLGLWQLDRAEQKQQRLEIVEKSGEMGKMPLRSALQLSMEEILDTTVQLNGNVKLDTVFYWDNRIVEGMVGYQIIVPVVTDYGTLLVDFGWVSLGSSREFLPQVSLPATLNDESAVITQPQLNAFVKETLSLESPWPKRIQQVDFDIVSQHLGVEPLPYVAVLQESYKGQFVKNYKPVVMPPEKHLGYAIQWFGLAIAAFVIYGFALWKQHERRTKN